jgi:hypothetical protein
MISETEFKKIERQAKSMLKSGQPGFLKQQKESKPPSINKLDKYRKLDYGPEPLPPKTAQ